MAQSVKVYQDQQTVTVLDSADFPAGEFPPICDDIPPLEVEPCIDRSYDCSEAIVLVVPEGWMESEEYIEVSDYGYHLEDDPSCDLSTGFYMMMEWTA